MPSRKVTIDGRTWQVMPSGFVTQYDRDEFGLFFVAGSGASRELRITRYSPHGARSREASLAEMSEARLAELFRLSQPSEMAPEAGYST